jgi:hypothetical protein
MRVRLAAIAALAAAAVALGATPAAAYPPPDHNVGLINVPIDLLSDWPPDIL